MKKIATLILLFITIQCFGQKDILPPPKVDTRIELLSIVFRLAENWEYSSQTFKLYTDRIEKHFAPYKNHELIRFAKKLKQENKIGYDAVMYMAIHIDEKLNPLKPFTDEIPEKRWGKDNAYEFVRLLKAFYKDARCEEFFRANKNLYQQAGKSFLPVYEKLDLQWYKSFFGKEPNEKFVIVNGLGNGGGNYGPDIVCPNGKREVYAIMGTWEVNNTGNAAFSINDYFPILLHEFNHSFVNYLIDKNEGSLKNNGEKMYDAVKKEMNDQAYSNWKTMLQEALVRASVIKYMKDHNFSKEQITGETNEQLSSGFVWMNELVQELENYSRQRNAYPTLESYMPKITEAYNTWALNMNSYIRQAEAMRPAVQAIREFKNNDREVSAELKTISIDFDKSLSGTGNRLKPGKKGKEHLPPLKSATWSEDKKTVVLEVTLEKDKEYQFILPGALFMTSDKLAMKDYEVNFKTR